MKIEKKDGETKIKIHHNKKLLWTIIILLAILILLMVLIRNKNKIEEDVPLVDRQCYSPSDCVPDSCCHATKCVKVQDAPKCDKSICTMDCSTPLDCNRGYCGCSDGKCVIIPNI